MDTTVPGCGLPRTAKQSAEQSGDVERKQPKKALTAGGTQVASRSHEPMPSLQTSLEPKKNACPTKGCEGPRNHKTYIAMCLRHLSIRMTPETNETHGPSIPFIRPSIRTNDIQPPTLQDLTRPRPKARKSQSSRTTRRKHKEAYQTPNHMFSTCFTMYVTVCHISKTIMLDCGDTKGSAPAEPGARTFGRSMFSPSGRSKISAGGAQVKHLGCHSS